MANIENNQDNNKDKLSEKIEDTVNKTVENIKGTVENIKDTVQDPIGKAEESIKQATEDVQKLSWWAKLFLWIAGIGLVLVLSLLIIVNLPATKNYLAQRVLKILNQDFKTRITTENVEVNIFGDVIISGLTIKDHRDADMLKAKTLRADSDWISVIEEMAFGDGRQLNFTNILLRDADLKVITYKGEEQDNFTNYIDNFDDGTPSDPNKKPFELITRASIQNSKVSIVNQNNPDSKEGHWLTATNLNANVPEVKVVGPNTKVNIRSLSFDAERFGKKHEVRTISGQLQMTHDFLSIKDMLFYTDHSAMRGDVVLHIDKKTRWSDFNNKVIWDMDLKQSSVVHGYDISYFVSNWDNYQPYTLSGKMDGVLNDFTLKNFLLKSKDNEFQTQEIRLAKLVDGDFNIKTNQISANFTYKGLKAVLPKLVSGRMGNFADDFGRIKYNGMASVNPKSITAKGNLITGIGQAQVTQLNLIDYTTNRPKYQGIFDVNDLNVTALSKMKEVGLVSGSVEVSGEGFDVNTLSLKTRSQIRSIDLMGKKLQNILVDGVLARKQFNGIIDSKDGRTNGRVKGKIDFSTPRIFADVRGNIQHLDLAFFGIDGGGASIVRGNVDGKISFTNINDLDLTADLTEVVIDGTKKIAIPNGAVKVTFEDGNRLVNVDMPNVVTGEIRGRYNLGDLGKMVQSAFHKVLVGAGANKVYRGQNFTFNFDVHQNLVNYFDPNITIPNGAKVSGTYEGNTNDLVMNADAMALTYIMTKKEEISEADKLLAQSNPNYKIREGGVIRDSISVNNISLKINTPNPSEHLFARIDRVEYNKNVLRDVLLNGKNDNNQRLLLTSNFKHGTLDDEKNDELKSYAVSIDQSRDANGDIVVKFNPTELKLNNFVWNVDTSPELNHSITYRRKTGDFLIKNLRLYSEDSEIFVNGVFKSAKDFNAEAEVKNMDIAKVFALIPGQANLDIKGIANGTLKVKMSENNFEPIVDITVKDVLMNGRDMGNITINAKNSGVRNIFDVEAKVSSADIIGNNSLNVKGTIDNNFPSAKLNFDADLKDFNLAFVQTFVKDVFTNFRGYATGLIKLEGNLKNFTYNGDVALRDFGLKVNFSGVDYKFDDTNVLINDGNLIFNLVGVKDGRTNSKGMISLGQINLGNFSNIGANILVRADNLMMLDTTQRDFDTFWGKVYAQGDLFVEFSDTRGLRIDATDTKILNNSIITFNSNTTSSYDEFKMLKFLKEDEQGVISIGDNKKKSLNININLDFSVDKGSTVNVLVGDQVGDISVRGTSEKMLFKMSRAGMELNGTYIVDNGTYVSKAILEKTFEIERGSNIQWSGDALNPELDINASYLRTVSNAGEYLGIADIPAVNVQLQTKITGNMKSPKVGFDIKMPEVASSVREQLAFKLTEDEKLLQFGSILLLNNFNVTNSGLAINVGNQGVNMLFKQLGSVFSSISKDFQLDFDYVANDQFNNIGDRLNTRANFVLSPRIKVKTGLGVPITKTDNPNAQMNFLTGEGTLEYDWSKTNDGSRLLRFYSKPSNIGLVIGTNAGANQSYGLGVVVSKNFNSFFPKRKKDSIVKKSNIDSIKKENAK